MNAAPLAPAALSTAEIEAVNKAVKPTLKRLEARWADECAYEDFAHYVTAMQALVLPRLPAGTTFVSARNTHPFGIVVRVPEMTVDLRFGACGWASALRNLPTTPVRYTK